MWSYEVSGIGHLRFVTLHVVKRYFLYLSSISLKSYNAAVPKKIALLTFFTSNKISLKTSVSRHLSSIHIFCFSTWHAPHFMALTAVAHATTADLLLSKALGQQHWLLRWWESSHRFVGVEGDSQYISRFNLGDVMGCVCL